MRSQGLQRHPQVPHFVLPPTNAHSMFPVLIGLRCSSTRVVSLRTLLRQRSERLYARS